MNARRLRLGMLVWVCVLASLVVLGASVGSAAVTHELLSGVSATLNEGVPAVGPHSEAVAVPGQFGALQSMTVDSGELYVDEGVGEGKRASRIDKFDASSGAFLAQLPQVPAPSPEFLHQGLVVGRSTGEAQLYVAGDAYESVEGPGVVAVLGLAGGLKAEWSGADTPSGSFGCFECGPPTSVAVDGSSSLGDWAAGDVYVDDERKGVVDVFKPEAGGGEKYEAQLTGPEPPGVLFSRPVSVAVNQSNGEVLVVDGEGASEASYHVDIFRPAAIVGQYEFVGELTGPLPGGAFERVTGVTVDGGNGDIYVAESAGVVEQFNSSGEHTGRLTGTPAGPFNSLRSLAVDPVSHDVYVGDSGGGEHNAGVVDAFGPNIVIPDVLSEEASNVTPSNATLNGKVNPDKEGEASCQFMWGTTRQFGQLAPCEPENVGEGPSSVPVHASLSGLQPDTTYYYRLQATNKNGTNPGDPSQDQQFTTAGPGIHSESVSNVAGASATLDATIDPNGAPTTYYFQYGTDSAYGADVPAPPGVTLGFGEGDVEASQHVQGLSAGTTYHYRVVAVSELAPGKYEAFDGPDQTFTTQTAGGQVVLPDGRAWEMVSPPDKHGALIVFAAKATTGGGALAQASVGGGAMTYLALSPTEGDPQGYAKTAQVLSTRGPAGWSSRDIGTPREKATGPAVGEGEEYRFFSEDLSSGVIQLRGGFIPSSSPLALSPREASEQTAFLRTDYLHGDVNDPCMESCYRPLVTGAPGYANVPEGTAFGEEGRCPALQNKCGPVFVGASPDLTHVVLQSKAPLTSGANSDALYEWTGGRLVLVSVLPESEEPAPEPNLGTGVSDAARHAVSDDGSRIVWSESKGHLYMRDTARGKTVTLDAPEPECLSKGTCGSGGVGPVFQAASSDGSRVFFTDAQHLTEDSGGSSSGGPDLYACKIVEAAGKLQCRLSDLTPVSSGEAASMPGEVLGTSEDGSWVYFVANNVLAQGAVPGKCSFGSPPPGATCNLYVWHDGTTRLVAILSNEDSGDWDPLSLQTARVSSDGRWLAFMSQRELTGYDTRDAVSGKQDEEVYLYDAEGTGRLVCASCNPTGARPVGMLDSSNSSLVDGRGQWDGRWLAGNVPAWTSYELGHALYQSRYLSDGGRMFFDSNDALVPQDVNGREDVYEYEPPGVGGCTSASVAFSERSGGCVGLVSSGASAEESAFIDASEMGEDVFFGTTAKLVSQDFDTAFDVYDAHECTGASPCFPVAAAVPPVCTTADSCRAAPSPQPSVFGSPSSATFSGAGNVTPASTGPVVKAKTKPLSRAQKLARARKACHVRKSRRKRAVCESQARKKYGSSAKSRKGGK